MKNYLRTSFYFFSIIVNFLFAVGQNSFAQENDRLLKKAEESLKKGIEYFHSINIQGGYVYFYTTDLKEKWGEGSTDDSTIEVQPPGTPAVGLSFLKAYKVTGDKSFLRFAHEAGRALFRGQNEYGGWDHKIYFDGKNKKPVVSLDDDQTQSAIRFLMALDQEIKNDTLRNSVNKALNMMLAAQMPQGGWPHKYPKQGNYHDYATFNDAGINRCIDVMLDAYRIYKDDRFYNSLVKVGNYILISQLPPPQPGWAQQYNEFLQPVWARPFEPPSVCPPVTLNNINSLMDLFIVTGNDTLLFPVTDALQWVKDVKMPNGKWPRFAELNTNKPLFYDRGRIRRESFEELSPERNTGYGYQRDLSELINTTEMRYEQMKTGRLGKFQKPSKEEFSIEKLLQKKLEIEKKVKKIIQAQDEMGRWVSKNDKFKAEIPNKAWNGQYIVKDRISSEVFNNNVLVLCEYINIMNELKSERKSKN
ncbi:MAG TPA: pectate lyase [Melioribacteraceae bacterium]|nr:pectate lyase [Melioribacteraceae bacterium]